MLSPFALHRRPVRLSLLGAALALSLPAGTVLQGQESAQGKGSTAVKAPGAELGQPPAHPPAARRRILVPASPRPGSGHAAESAQAAANPLGQLPAKPTKGISTPQANAGADASPKAEAAALEETDFIRFEEDDKGASLQTAIASYESPAGVKVDLVGAVHIADKAYFEGLNKRFKGYDAVLYELVGRPVAERETLESGDGEEKLQWLGKLQETMRSTLALESQLKIVDYHAPNFVHADMTTEGFFDTQEEKKESFFTLWMKAAAAQGFGPSTRPQPGVLQVLEIFMRKDVDSATELKRLLGRQFDSVEEITAGVESGDGTVIIGERNRHALEVMDREIGLGKRRLAIFYGAAHLADMEERLIQRGFKKVAVEWIKAWDLPSGG